MVIRVAILPMPDGDEGETYQAIADGKQSSGRTIGEAIDALTVQLSDEERTSLMIIQSFRPDRFFSADQQQRLGTLMDKWRAARDAGVSLPQTEQVELDALIDEELRASALRAESIADQLV